MVEAQAKPLTACTIAGDAMSASEHAQRGTADDDAKRPHWRWRRRGGRVPVCFACLRHTARIVVVAGRATADSHRCHRLESPGRPVAVGTAALGLTAVFGVDEFQ